MTWEDRIAVAVVLFFLAPVGLFLIDGFAWVLLGHFVMFDWTAERVCVAVGAPFVALMVAAGMHG